MRLDAVRRVEVVAFGEHLDREAREDAREPVGHPGIVVRVEAARGRA
jgi:hypothetical protein